MIKLEQKEQANPEYLSQGGLCRFNRCEALYCFHSILGLRVRNTAPALAYGKAMHCAIPWLQRGDYKKALTAFSLSWEDSGCESDKKRGIESAMRTLKEWFENRARPYTLLKPPETGYEPEERRSEDEFAFLVDLNVENKPHVLPFYGLVDGIGQAGKDLWVVEYKTTSELGTRFLNSFTLNVQLISYVTAITILMPSAQVQGAFVEAIRVSPTNAESQCIPIFVHDWQMSAFIENYQKVCERIAECCKLGEWSQDFGACTTYSQYGSPGYQCKFMDLCNSPDWRMMLPAYDVDFSRPFDELKETLK